MGCVLGLSVALLLAACGDVPRPRPPPPRADLEAFVREGCPHCRAAEAWIDELLLERPGLQVTVLDVVRDREARARLDLIAEATGAGVVGTPAFYVRGRLLVGWRDDATPGRLEAWLEEPAGGGAAEAGDTCPVDPAATCITEGEATPLADEAVDVPLFGTIRPREVGLPLFTVILGLVDGFNPCAMWVLIFLLSLLVNLHDRRKMLLIAGTFVVVSGFVYFAFMAAWLHVQRWIGMFRGVQLALGLVALGVGALNVKDAIAFHRGPSLAIPEAAKPGIYERVRRILRAPTVTAALAGVVVLAFMVNLVELLCTAGFPAVYTNVLVRHDLPLPVYYGYIALYQVFYMLDDTVMLLIAVVTLSRTRLQERGGRVLKLLSGVVMLALGLVLVFRPAWLAW